MAETDLTPEEAAADARLPLYNVGDYDPVSNPYGFDNDGHQVNQMPQARDAGVMARLARRLALFTQGLANTVAANVLLTAEDAENTRLDRIATGQDVITAAGSVGDAKAEADRAKGYAEGLNLPPITVADRLKFMRAKADGSGIEFADAGSMPRRARTANVQITKADVGALIDITGGTFTQAFATPAALGDGFFCYIRQGGSGDVTIPASDGRTNWIMYPGEVRLFQCDGTTLRSVVLAPFTRVWSANGQFVRPPGYIGFGAVIIGGGGGGAVRGTGSTSATGGAPAAVYGLNFIPYASMPQNPTISVGAPGVGATASGNSATVNGGAGGVSSIDGFYASAGGSQGIGIDPDLLSQPSALANDAIAFQSGYGVHLRFGQLSNRFNTAAGPFGFAGGQALGDDGTGVGAGGAARDNSAFAPVKAGNGGRGEVRIWGIA